MKGLYSKKIIFLILVTLLVAALVFSACSRSKKTIPVPSNLSIENNVLSWDPVSGAITYDVKVDETIYSVQETSFSLPITDYEYHEITVRVNTYDGTGEYAPALTYARRAPTAVLPQLSVPYGISMTGNRVMWSTVLNNNGYKIYMGESVFTVKKNATYYDLTFPGDGTYYIRMQTIGDEVTYATSKVSNAYAVTVKGGKAPLQKLPQTEFTFEAESKKLVWTNRYAASAVSYEIYRNEEAIPVATIPADATKVKLSYDPNLTGNLVSYTMRLISNDGLYNPSDFNAKITFPIADKAPANLALTPDEESGEYRLTWSAARYQDGYVTEIDGVEGAPVTGTSAALPALSAGRHVARIRTKGNGVYYANSLYSEGLVFYAEENGLVLTALERPTELKVEKAEAELLTLSAKAVKKATGYEFAFRTAGATYLLTSALPVIEVTKEGAMAHAEEILAALTSGVCVSVRALADGAPYADSLYSEEVFATASEQVALLPPKGFTYDKDGFTWNAVSEEATYEILLDGEIKDTSEGISVGEGAHLARIRQKGELSLWSEEISLRLPLELDPPTDLAVTANILSFKGVEQAVGYALVSNGTRVAVLYPTDNLIDLSLYLKTDGNYTLELIAVPSGGVYRESAPSAQYLYVKTDGAYGTESKPFNPQSAEELWSLMREYPNAYYLLTAGGTYDFANVDLSSSPAFAFGGVVMGNGATLKGINIRTSLFRELTGATIRNLTVEITARAFDYTESGLLAKTITESSFFGVNFSLSGRTDFKENSEIGALCYQASGVTLRETNVRYDLTLVSGGNSSVGLLAQRFDGTLSTVEFSGNVVLSGRDVTFGGISVEGDSQITGMTTMVSLTLNATGRALAAGCVTNGSVTAVGLTSNMTMTLSGDEVSAFGVSEEGASVRDSTIGGVIIAEAGRSAELYGVGARSLAKMENVTVSALLQGRSEEELVAAGFADELEEDTALAGLAFTGEIRCDARKATAAACAISSAGELTFRSGGTIFATGENAILSAGVLYARAISVEQAGAIRLRDLLAGEIGGSALSATGEVAVSGALEVEATGCGDIRFGGVVGKGVQTLSIENYRVFGSLASEVLRFGGVSYEASDVDLSASGLSVEVSLSAEELYAAGALLSATRLTLAGATSLRADIAATGDGEVAGFALMLPSVSLTDLTVTGTLSLKGTGSLCGVAGEAGETNRVRSSLALVGEGAVSVYGLFRRAASVTDPTLSGTIRLASDHVAYYGIAERIADGTITGATVTDLTVTAEPLGKERSEARIYGLFGSAKLIDGAALSNLTFTIGTFDNLAFAGLSSEVTERARNLSVSYTLLSEAIGGQVGGAFLTAKGTLSNLTLGGVASPVVVTCKGETRFGGLATDPESLTLSEGSANLQLTMDLAAESESLIGGLFAEIGEGREVTISGFESEVSLLRKGLGEARIGGVAGRVSGTLVGAKVDLNLLGGRGDDLIGGVAAELSGGAVTNAGSRGSVTTEGTVGGMIGSASYATLERAASVMTLTSSYLAGGLVAGGSNLLLRSVYSLSDLTEKGAGLFAEGTSITIDEGYFAGRAKECALAVRAVNCTAHSLYLDASSVGVDGLAIVGEGALSYEVRSFGYGYLSSELGSAFMTDGKRFPYLKAVGYLSVGATANAAGLDPIEITGAANLYDLLPRRTADGSIVTWVDESGLLSVEGGIASVLENGEGTLSGYLSGGAVAYTLSYVAKGLIPLSGEGTEENPYLITEMRYFKYVKDFAAEHPSAYFRLAIGEEELEGAAFDALFTADEPFRGHFDFDDLLLVNPVIGETGLLGYLEGATVTNLRLSGDIEGVILAAYAKDSLIRSVTIEEGALSGEITLIAEAENVTVQSVVLCADVTGELVFTLISEMTGGTLSGASLSFSVNTAEDVTGALIGSVKHAEVEDAQMLWQISISGKLTLSLSEEDEGSTYTDCMTIVEGRRSAGEESLLVGLSGQASGTHYLRCVVLLRANGVPCAPLIGAGDATYEEVLVLTDGEESEAVGVTYMQITGAKSEIAALEGYVAGAIATPLGYDLFGEEADGSFSVGEDKIVISDKLTLDGAFVLAGEKPFSTFVGYTFTGDCATLAGGVLTPKSNGSGTLTLTNLYGVTRTVTVTVEEFDGFAEGEGTEVDPYRVASFEDFKRMLSRSDNSLYYTLVADVAGEISEAAPFYGVLLSDHHTVTVTLAADSLFTIVYGRIEGVDFCLQKESLTTAGGSGLFAESASGMTLADCAITIDCPIVTVTEEDAIFGLLFKTVENDSTIEGINLSVGSCLISATGGQIGVLAGKADGSFIKEVTITGDVTLLGGGEIVLGAVGFLQATSAVSVSVDPDTELQVVRYFTEDITLDLTLTATADELLVGGVAGRSSVAIKGVSGTVSILLAEGTGAVTAGGVVGQSDYAILNVNLTVSVATETSVSSGKIGGVAGELGGEIGASIIHATLSVTAEGELAVGGAMGYGYGNLTDLAVTADILAHSSAEAGAVTALLASESPYKSLAAAGGAAGKGYGDMHNVAVAVTRVQASADYAESDLDVVAGGIAGEAYALDGCTVTGGSEVTATGGNPLRAETCPRLIGEEEETE